MNETVQESTIIVSTASFVRSSSERYLGVKQIPDSI